MAQLTVINVINVLAFKKIKITLVIGIITPFKAVKGHNCETSGTMWDSHCSATAGTSNLQANLLVLSRPTRKERDRIRTAKIRVWHGLTWLNHLVIANLMLLNTIEAVTRTLECHRKQGRYASCGLRCTWNTWMFERYHVQLWPLTAINGLVVIYNLNYRSYNSISNC